MKQQIICLGLIGLLMLTACSPETHSETTTETATEETGSTEVETKEPINEPEPLSVNYTDAGNPRVIYVSNGAIHILDVKTQEAQELPVSESAMAATFSEDGKSFYYTEGHSDFVELYQCKLTDPLLPKKLGKLEQPEQAFITDTYGESARLEIKEGVLYAECVFEWDMFSFNSRFEMPLETGEISFKSGHNPLYGFTYERRSIGQQKMKSVRASIQDLPIGEGGIQEIAYVENGTATQLSYSDSFYVDMMEDEMPMDEPKEYFVSPDGKKIWYTFLVEMGDLPHGPAILVNLDGSNPVVLNEDVMGMDHGDPIWLSDGSLMYLNEENLYLVTGTKNELQLIDEDVSGFQVDASRNSVE